MNTEESINKINHVDTFFFPDFNTFSRLDKMSEHVSKKDAYIILIDHHQDSKIVPDQSHCDTNICSTAELVYDFIKWIGTYQRKQQCLCIQELLQIVVHLNIQLLQVKLMILFLIYYHLI